MSNLRDKIIDRIITTEGGYVNDPSDSGGETMYGITVAVARKNGYLGDMKDLPLQVAKRIYTLKYWDSLSLDRVSELSNLVAEELADTGVNLGITRAGQFLQESLNALNNCGQYYDDLFVDGFVGRKTLRALEIYINFRGSEGEIVLFNMLNCLQGSFYIDLAKRRDKDERFIFGWFKHRISIK